METSRRLGMLVLVAYLLSPSMGYSILGVGDIVFDPSNYATAVLNEVNTAKAVINDGIMISNQARMLENQAASLLNDAKNLKANPLRLLGQIEGLWQAYNDVMGHAEGLAFGLATAQARFTQAYPALATPSIQAITQQGQAMLTSIRQASQTAIASQSVYERLCDQLANNRLALTAAQASAGALEIAQAQAQIQALGNEQLATLAQIETTTGRVQTEWISMQVKERVDAAAVNTNFVTTYGSQGFKGIGQSTPIDLR
jgi:P-type conjugative transfer protein TrbJ